MVCLVILTGGISLLWGSVRALRALALPAHCTATARQLQVYWDACRSLPHGPMYAYKLGCILGGFYSNICREWSGDYCLVGSGLKTLQLVLGVSVLVFA